MGNELTAWDRAETFIYEQLKELLSGEEGVTAFEPDEGLPRSISDTTATDMWTFGIENADDITQVNAGDQWCSWETNGAFRGIFTSRKRAKLFMGLIKSWGTYRNDPNKILRVAVQSFALTRGTIFVSAAAERTGEVIPKTGGEIQVWALEILFETIFGNAEA